jgi:hypothetical protein
VDSAFIICVNQGNDVVLYATHANIPDSEYDGIKGWHEHYGDSWKNLAGNPISESIKM